MKNNICEVVLKLKNESELIKSHVAKLLLSDGDCINIIKRYYDHNDYELLARYFSENGFSVSFANKGSDYEKMTIGFNTAK